MTKKTFITAFNRTEDSVKTNVVKFTKPSMVKKSLAYACNIQNIYDEYCCTGRLPLNGNPVLDGLNMINSTDLISAQKSISEASNYFNSLPTDVKNHYGNSLVDFVKAVENKDSYLYDCGVFTKPVVEFPTSSAPVVKPTGSTTVESTVEPTETPTVTS